MWEKLKATETELEASRDGTAAKEAARLPFELASTHTHTAALLRGDLDAAESTLAEARAAATRRDEADAAAARRQRRAPR